MQTDLAVLREDRELAVEEMKTLAATVETEGRSFTEDELKRYDELDQQQDELKAQIATIERAEKVKALTPKKVESYNAAPSIRVKRQASKQDYNNAIRAWACVGQAGVSIKDEWKRSADLVDVDYGSKELVIRAQSSDVTLEGANLDNDSVFVGIVEAKKAFGGMESVSHVIPTSDGAPIHFATVDDTSSAAAASSQNTQVGNTGFQFPRVTLNSHSYKTACHPLSLELLQDAQFDIGGWIGTELGRRIARTLNAEYTNGSSNVTGILQDTTEALETATASVVAKEDLYGLYFAVDAEYRNSPNCVWQMSDSTLQHLLEQLEDTTGQPIWGSGLNTAPGASILGKRVVINNDMPAIADDAAAVMFGDFYHYKIRQAGPIRVVRDDSRYIDQLAVGVFAWQRVDGKLVDPGNAPVKHLTIQASA